MEFRGCWKRTDHEDGAITYDIAMVHLPRSRFNRRLPPSVSNWLVQKNAKGQIITSHIFAGVTQWSGVCKERDLDAQLDWVDSILRHTPDTLPLMMWMASYGIY